MVDFYSDIDELKYKIAMAISKIINDVPMPGWVRADQAEKAIETAGNSDVFQRLQEQLVLIQDAIIDKVEQTSMKWEPFPTDEMQAMHDKKKEDIEVPILSNEAKMLLQEATKDSAGQILMITSLEGTEIQTNHMVMNRNKIGKDVAVWKAALDELKNHKLIIAVGYKNEIFQLTRYGYEVSEKI